MTADATASPGEPADEEMDAHDLPGELGMPTEPSGEVDLQLRAARLWITVNRPYYSRALFACRLLVTEQVVTMAIDRKWQIYANPEYVTSLSVAETAGLIIHNLNHALRAHAQRATAISAEARSGNVWQVACDCEINDDLAADGLSLPEGLAFPYFYAMMNGGTAERYFRQLHEGGWVETVTVQFSELVRSSSGSGATGIPEPYEIEGDDLGDHEQQMLRSATARAIREHASSHGRGTVPGGLQRWADAQLEPKVDWRRALASAVRRAVHQRNGSADYSWRRPPRRQQPDSPLLLPGSVRPVPALAVVIDTSASMSQDALGQGLAEIQAILTRVVPGHAINVLAVDAKVAASTRVFAARQVQLGGGGGTDMRVGIEEAAKSKPAAIVIITDGYTPWPKMRPRGVQTLIAALVGDDPPAKWVPDWIRTVIVA